METCHITPFRDQDVVVCLWEGCKMYNVPSSSHEWLKRHMQREHTKVGKGIMIVYVHVMYQSMYSRHKFSVVFSHYRHSTM